MSSKRAKVFLVRNALKSLGHEQVIKASIFGIEAPFSLTPLGFRDSEYG